MTFPSDREAKRRVLLDAVESVREVVVATADESEARGDLAPAAVRAIEDAKLWAMKLPAELGGAEADPVTQFEVIERMAYYDSSAGWATMIGATSIGWMGAFLPDAAVAQIFANGRIPRAAGGGAVPTGTVTRIEGGYLLTGTFGFVSGIPHSEWVLTSAVVPHEGEPPPGLPPEVRFFVSRTTDVKILDDWHVAGLKGSGSNSYATDNLFVPAAFTFNRLDQQQGRPQRGGPIFRMGMPGFVMNEHAAFIIGCARRSLDLIIEYARTKRRGFAQTIVADRQVFQRAVGEADFRLRAARLMCLDVFEGAWQCVSGGGQPDFALTTEMRAAATYATEVAVDVTTMALRYAGGSAISDKNLLQRYWRDANAAAQHQGVSDSSYETHGQVLLGLVDGPPATDRR